MKSVDWTFSIGGVDTDVSDEDDADGFIRRVISRAVLDGAGEVTITKE